MTTIGFHASQEQIAPAQLLKDVQHAEQATAKLGQMFEGRYWCALGAGQLMNEHVVGGQWPSQEERRSRLAESADLIRRLHRGEWITQHRQWVDMDQAHLFDRPHTPVPLYAACVTPDSAQRAAAWAEGIITLNLPGAAEHDVVAAYREAGGAGPVMLQVHLRWAETEAQAQAIAHDQWRTNVFGPPLDQDLPAPEHFDVAAAEVSADTVLQAVWTSSSAAAHTEGIAAAAETFDAVYLHHVGQHQRPWLDIAGEQIMPALKKRS